MWPVYGMEPARYYQLRKGDRVCRYNTIRSNPRVAQVLEISPREDVPPLLVITLAVDRCIEKSRVKVIQVRSDSAVRVERDRNCDQFCCERHRVERGPGATFCADHWQSWSDVA